MHLPGLQWCKFPSISTMWHQTLIHILILIRVRIHIFYGSVSPKKTIFILEDPSLNHLYTGGSQCTNYIYTGGPQSVVWVTYPIVLNLNRVYVGRGYPPIWSQTS